MGAPPGTVRSIISDRRRCVEDDVAEDYEYVDEEFRGEYPQAVAMEMSNKVCCYNSYLLKFTGTPSIPRAPKSVRNTIARTLL